MMRNILTIIIILIIILFYYRWSMGNLIKQFIYGWYGADPVFCERASLDSIILYLDKDNHGYILMKGSDQSIILNDSFTYKLKEHPVMFDNISKEKTYTIDFGSLDYQEFFPSLQILEFTPLTQRIRLYSSDTDLTHAVLYKNNTVSDVMNLIDDKSNLEN